MYYKKKSNVIFRKYDSFGYITDNRNFGYRRINESENNIGDKILSESGAIFFSVLEHDPLNINQLVEKISRYYDNADKNIIKCDALEFYDLLKEDGFVLSGNTIQECLDKDVKFSYITSKPESLKRQFSSSAIQIEKSTQEFLDEYFNEKPQLTNLHIEITSKCNERCIHCYIPHENKVKHIESNLFFSILDQCKELNVLHLTLSGGEPMLHKDFCEFLKRCHEYNFSINILSNLTLINDEIINEMSKNALLSVQVSLYSMNPGIHDEITQMKGSFYKTLEGIYKLIENNIPLQISCPILTQNNDCYNDVINWAKDQNIQISADYVIIGRYDHSSTNLGCRLSFNQIEQLIYKKAIEDPYFVYQLKLEAQKKKNNDPDDYVCSICQSSICISETGLVYPCAGWQDYVLGNVNHKSLIEIWNKSERVEYLRNLRKHNFPKCLSCSNKEYCTMCMVRNANESPDGDPLIINEYFCKIAEINKLIVKKNEHKFND